MLLKIHTHSSDLTLFACTSFQIAGTMNIYFSTEEGEGGGEVEAEGGVEGPQAIWKTMSPGEDLAVLSNLGFVHLQN